MGFRLFKTALFAFIVFDFAGAKAAPNDIEAGLKKVISQHSVPMAALSILVLDNDGNDLVKINEGILRIPASLSKLATAYGVLKSFGPEFKVQTQMLSQASVEKNVLKGSLFVRGAGDPSFVSEKLWYLVNEFTRQDISEIDGDLIIDDTKFDADVDGEDESNSDRAYNAPVSAMSFNWNSVNIFVRPASIPGQPAIVKIDPATSFIELKNKALTGKKGDARSITVERENQSGGDRITVKGSIPLEDKELVIYKNISSPAMWAGNQIVSFLKQRGIVVHGMVKTGVVPEKVRVLAESPGSTLPQMISDMMKFSNNYIAEMLTKLLAAHQAGVPGTSVNGLRLIREKLAKIGLSSADYVLQNPAGFSKENRFSARAVSKILQAVKNDFLIFPEFSSALPIAGVDGTLKNRMKGTPAQGRIRAKTGLLTGANGLAGFAGRKDGSQLTFVFIHNGSQDFDTVRRLFDEMAIQLVQ